MIAAGLASTRILHVRLHHAAYYHLLIFRRSHGVLTAQPEGACTPYSILPLVWKALAGFKDWDK